MDTSSIIKLKLTNDVKDLFNSFFVEFLCVFFTIEEIPLKLTCYFFYHLNSLEVNVLMKVNLSVQVNIFIKLNAFRHS